MIQKSLALADYAVIVAFFAVMIGVGVYYSRRSKSSDQFFGNDKTVPWWLSGVSFYMNSFSALAFVMYSALAYKFGWVPVTVSWLSVPAVLLGAWFLAVRWRRAAKGSPIDYIASRYTPGMCRTLAILGLPMQLLDNALKLLAIGTVVGVGMGFPLFWSICLSGVIIVLYTFLGGLKATLACDFIQFLIILAVVFTLPFMCLERLADFGGGEGLMFGMKTFFEKVPVGFFDFTAGKYTWVYMLVFFCAVGSTLSTNWSLVQRYYSTKSERDAKKMAYLVAALLFVGPPLFFFPAMAARIFIPDIPEAEMNGVYAIVCKSVLPVGMVGMVIAAMFSATMSSLAGNFNAVAAVIVNELYLKLDRTASAARRMIAARLATILTGGAVVALTFVMQYAQGADDLFNLSNKVFGVFLPPIAIPMLAGIFVRRLSRRSGMVALVGGIAVGLAVFAVGGIGEYSYLREMIWVFPITAASTAVLLVAGTKIFPDKDDERAEVEEFFGKIEGVGIKNINKILLLAAVVLPGALCEARPVWKDPVPVGGNSAIWKLSGADELRVDVLAPNLFRVRRSWTNCWTESGMNRYGVLKREWPETDFTRSGDTLKTAGAEMTVDAGTGTLFLKSLSSPADIKIEPKTVGKGYSLRIPLAADERMYGLGDVSRENIQRRGRRYEIWVKNVNSYIPMPMIVSSKRWGLFVNTTWRNYFDVGEKDKDALICEAPEGDIDFYVFTGKDYKALLDIYTQLTGRPQMLPAFGYGFTFVANQFIDQFNLVRDAYEFRKTGTPCDVLGLEPGWMEQFYDFSTRKTWNPRLFTFPSWSKAKGMTWIGALERIGFKLSLWLCVDYDLYRYEEQCAVGAAKAAGRKMEPAEGIPETWVDQNVVGEIRSRRKTETNVFVTPGIDRSHGDEVNYKEGDQPWFEHLKKFVDRGAQCFKLDGSRQVTPHDAKRKWANGMTTEEAHNLYPLVYDKQMSRGYEDYTSRRSMVYSAGGYVGVQQYVATWAGDTGGGPKPLVSCMNLGMSGHANQSCDMNPFSASSIHFAVLSPWMQQNNWDQWDLPWLHPDEHVRMTREYIKLRYRLFPYIYSTSAHAAETGWPIMRSLPFVYPDRKEYDEAKGTYMFGDMMLVSAFVDEMDIPEGIWHDWRTGETVKGPCRRKVATTPMWGGALYVKAGAIVPTWPQKRHIDKGWNDKVIVKVWPTADGEFTLHEDDGISLDYRKSGKVAKTKLSLKREGDGALFTVGARRGSFRNMPDERVFDVEFHLAKAPACATVDGRVVNGVWDGKEKTFTVQAGESGAKDVAIRIK